MLCKLLLFLALGHFVNLPFGQLLKTIPDLPTHCKRLYTFQIFAAILTKLFSSAPIELFCERNWWNDRTTVVYSFFLAKVALLLVLKCSFGGILSKAKQSKVVKSFCNFMPICIHFVTPLWNGSICCRPDQGRQAKGSWICKLNNFADWNPA